MIAEQQEMLTKIRSFRPGDEAFIYATWLKCFRESGPYADRLESKVYFKNHHDLIERLLKSSNTLIAVLPEDDNVIIGYATFDRAPHEIMHFLYVKSDFQGMGIARELFIQSGLRTDDLIFTHWTRPMRGLTRKYPRLIYYPYMCMG